MSSKQQSGASIGKIDETCSLQQVDDLIRKSFECEAPALRHIAEYLLDLGGKRFRPLLCLLSAQACGQPEPSAALLEMGAALELVHMATLLHDDIIDRSVLRRRKVSPLNRFGMGPTLLTGDFLLVRAFGLCARQEEFIVKAAEKACVELTEGEILESSLLEQTHSLDSALVIAEKKTAALFWLAALCGAHLADADEKTVAAFGAMGRSMGIAFQICDDILDVVAEEAAFGKRCGTDIRERKPTVVNMIWLAYGGSLAERLLQPPDRDEENYVTAALAAIKQGPVLAEARNLAEHYTQTAAATLETALSEPDAPKAAQALAALKDLINYTSKRLE